MKRSYSILLCGLIALAVCTGCRPKGILHSWEMRDIIIDLHKTDALLTVKHIGNSDTEARTVYYAQVLEAHGVTQATFDSSLVWYTAHPQLFDKIYPKVMAQLKEEEEEFIALHPEFAAPKEKGKKTIEQETTVFTRTTLDSVLWVTREGYGHSWHSWQRPYSIRMDD